MSLTVAQALAEARAQGLDRLDAQLLLAWVLEQSRAWLVAHDEDRLNRSDAQRFRAAAQRRSEGEPLAYIVGEKEFHGLTLRVDANVLVPRPDTETLVDWAIELLRHPATGATPARVIDLGTGSGAIALAVKHACPHAQLTAIDASEAALAVARANGERLGLAIDWRHGDWWQPAASERFELALSNPPYVAQGDHHLDALTHEPLMALASGSDGLDAIRQIVSQAAQHLAPRGWLLIEHGHDQANAVRELLSRAGFIDVQSRADLAGVLRCSGGRRS